MLEVQRRRLQYDSQQRAWDVVAEYFQLFRSGVGNATEQRPTGTNEVLCTTEAQQQLMFLRSTMASNVEFGRGDLIGVEALMGHWQRLSECHDGLHVQMEYLNKISDTIVIATATMSVTITKNTLEGIFPHLMGSESVEDLSLAVRLLGHRLSYPCSTLFVWDEASSLVVRLETDVDMATPLLKLLGNLDEVSRVLDGAVVFAQHDTC
ncbi:hypothetical protein PHYBOEH_010692 [Phytophthora boehmeriae]|uniref:Bzip transcription factor n=1 Tax=Phytophthora boehmeriae TaxID=109152 RepID=A0A8T1X3M5_9STRA|nr:hypothetical protein PHYBOEH_010692 [Phytophthora boehmeriae]